MTAEIKGWLVSDGNGRCGRVVGCMPDAYHVRWECDPIGAHEVIMPAWLFPWALERSGLIFAWTPCGYVVLSPSQPIVETPTHFRQSDGLYTTRPLPRWAQERGTELFGFAAEIEAQLADDSWGFGWLARWR